MDCIELMQEMIRGGVKADTLLTDIPYGECNGRTTISFSHHHLRNVDKGHADTMTFDMQEYYPLNSCYFLKFQILLLGYPHRL